MEVFLIPVGSSRYELYCEMPDDDPAEHSSSSHRPFFRNLLHRFREAIAEVERERHRAEPHTPPAGLYQRVKRAVLSRVAETMAEKGLAVLLYDHRNFGTSDGEPRQEADPWAQIRDYHRS